MTSWVAARKRTTGRDPCLQDQAWGHLATLPSVNSGGLTPKLHGEQRPAGDDHIMSLNQCQASSPKAFSWEKVKHFGGFREGKDVPWEEDRSGEGLPRRGMVMERKSSRQRGGSQLI